MANRLHPDDTKGQANWADIDDDDEDWAPETITWKDGTKIAIPHTEEIAPAPEPPAPAPAPAPQPKPVLKENGIVEKPKSPAPISLAGKPGVSVLTAGKGLVLKGAPEKPTLVAKPPAPPTPAKSPWGVIPKVDKVSLVAMDIPSQQHNSKLGPRDSISKSNTPPPPKEIAADDFSRAPWKENSGGGNRELFNSQSGRYEPVHDRRGSARTEPQPGRQPAVLQRASIHEQQGPAEPSPAFQTSRTSDQHVPYGRRRGSSNVSGGSGSFGNRLKGYDTHLPPPEVMNARRESFTGGSDSPVSPRNFSPHSGPRSGPGWPPRGSPNTTHASPYQQHAQLANMAPPVQPPPAAVEDVYETQKRLMRERRELAMKRRLEEEAREEAARKERIRLKLEALGPAPEPKSAKKAKDAATTPTQIQPREGSQQTQEPKAEESRERPVLNLAPPSELKTVEQPPINGTQPQPLPSPDTAESRPDKSSTPTHPWPSTAKQPERYPAPTWGSQPSKNVWGAPNNNRSLGNGTFVSDLGTTQLPQIPSKAGPGPIAPPSGVRPQASVPPSGVLARQPPIGPPKPAARVPGGGMSISERESSQNAWANAVRLNDDAFKELLNAQYDERERRLQKEGRSVADIQPVIKDSWRPTKLDENGSRSESTQKQSVLVGAENPWAAASEMKATGSQHTPSVPSATPSEYGQRTQSAATNRDGAPASSILGSAAATPQPVRGSRFFPSREARQESVAPVEVQRPKSPSPPPPDMAGHPAFDGDIAHPHVSLPRPQPVVRLPPPAVATEPRAPVPLQAPAGPASKAPNFSWAHTVAYKESEGSHVSQASASTAPRSVPHKPESSWQAKIDSLLGGRKTHPSAKLPAGVDSMSRSAFDHGDHATTISFLGFSGRWAAKETSMTTKDMAEECFEEQEMGSLPPVRLPNDVPESAWQPSPAVPKPLPKKYVVTVSSAEAIIFPQEMVGNGNVWRVGLPGHERKAVTVPFGRTRSNPRRGGGRGGRHPSSTNPRPGKGREPSSSYVNDHGPGPSSSSNIPPARNNRGNYRGREQRDTWSRNATAIQT